MSEFKEEQFALEEENLEQVVGGILDSRSSSNDVNEVLNEAQRLHATKDF